MFGLDKQLLKEIYKTSTNKRELNEHQRFDKLLNGADFKKVIDYFSDKDKKAYNPFTARQRMYDDLIEFIFGEDYKEN